MSPILVIYPCAPISCITRPNSSITFKVYNLNKLISIFYYNRFYNPEIIWNIRLVQYRLTIHYQAVTTSVYLIKVCR